MVSVTYQLLFIAQPSAKFQQCYPRVAFPLENLLQTHSNQVNNDTTKKEETSIEPLVFSLKNLDKKAM